MKARHTCSVRNVALFDLATCKRCTQVRAQQIARRRRHGDYALSKAEGLMATARAILRGKTIPLLTHQKG